MQGSLTRILAIGSAVSFGLALTWAAPCTAQYSSGGPTGIGAASQRTMRGAQQNQAKPEVAPPPVLPGTKAAPEAAAPSTSAASLSPTEALFDAINRGDAAAARDAVNRGADMHGQNVLGLTPLELSVDLGRNEISFLLLSMREEDPTSRARRGTNQRGVAQRDSDPRESMLLGAAARGGGRTRATTVSARAPDEPVVATPRLYSGNGGAPIPAAGFVGFDGGRAVR
jgi:hypothetical protein